MDGGVPVIRIARRTLPSLWVLFGSLEAARTLSTADAAPLDAWSCATAGAVAMTAHSVAARVGPSVRFLIR